MADYLLLKAGNKLAGTKLKRVILSLSALKGLTLDKALKINNGHILKLGRTVVNVDNAGVALPHSVNLGGNILVRNGGVGTGGLNALVLA